MITNLETRLQNFKFSTKMVLTVLNLPDIYLRSPRLLDIDKLNMNITQRWDKLAKHVYETNW